MYLAIFAKIYRAVYTMYMYLVLCLKTSMLIVKSKCLEKLFVTIQNVNCKSDLCYFFV